MLKAPTYIMSQGAGIMRQSRLSLPKEKNSSARSLMLRERGSGSPRNEGIEEEGILAKTLEKECRPNL